MRESGRGPSPARDERRDRRPSRTCPPCGCRRSCCTSQTGDGFLATFDGPGRAAQCALAIARVVEAIGIAVRAGVHTGEVELRGEDVTGHAVNLAARIAARAEAGEVLASRTVRDLVAGSGLLFNDRGTHEFKGVPDEWAVYAVT